MKTSPGSQFASRPRMDNDAPVIPVKQYGRADFQARERQHINANPPDLMPAVTELRLQNKRLLDKIARMEEMLQDELRYWKRGLDYDEWETREQLQRRMSRLRGAVEYIGNENGWRVTER